MRRVPIESAAPIVMFAIARLAVAVVALTAVAVVGFPYDGRAAAVLAIFVLWSVGVLAVARRAPDRVTNPVVAAGDFTLLLALELVAPDTLGAVRLTALFLIAAHAHFQGERRGLAIAAIGSTVLVLGSALRGDAPLDSDCSPSTRRCSCCPRWRRRWWSACSGPPSRPRGCALAASRAAPCRRRARCAAGWRSRSTTAPSRS